MSRLIDSVKADLAEAITQHPCRLTQDSQVVFVCGAALGKNTARDRLLQYARLNMPKDFFFKAESVFPAVGGNTHISDLLTLENEMAYLSDCIIILLETESTFAELGAFANNDLLVKQLLVINDSKYKACGSFVDVGPLAKIAKASYFGSALYAKFNSILLLMQEVELRINKRRKRRPQSIHFKDRDALLSPENARGTLLLLLQLVRLFSPITDIELNKLLQYIYNSGDYVRKLHTPLRLLQTIGLLSRRGDFLYYTGHNDGRDAAQLLTKRSFSELRGIILRHYHRIDRSRLDLVATRINE